MVMVGQAKRLEQPLRPPRWVLVVMAGVTLLAVVGIVLYVALSDDRYANSSAGCVNVTVASSTGGSPLHACGGAARRWCALEDARGDDLARLVQAQCRRAGIAPATGLGPGPAAPGVTPASAGGG